MVTNIRQTDGNWSSYTPLRNRRHCLCLHMGKTALLACLCSNSRLSHHVYGQGKRLLECGITWSGCAVILSRIAPSHSSLLICCAVSTAADNFPMLHEMQTCPFHPRWSLILVKWDSMTTSTRWLLRRRIRKVHLRRWKVRRHRGRSTKIFPFRKTSSNSLIYILMTFPF